MFIQWSLPGGQALPIASPEKQQTCTHSESVLKELILFPFSFISFTHTQNGSLKRVNLIAIQLWNRCTRVGRDVIVNPRVEGRDSRVDRGEHEAEERTE